MRKTIAAIALLAIAVSVNAQKTLIKANVSGDWQVAGTWSLGRVPANNDSIVIATGVTVTMTSGNVVNLTDIKLDIFGTLVLDERNGQNRGLVITTTNNTPSFLIRLNNASASIIKGTSGNRSASISVKVNNAATATAKYSTNPQADFGTTTPPAGQSFGPTVTGPAFAQNTSGNPLFFTTGSNASLPLSLTGLRAGISGKNITLNWTSLQEVNTQSFVIEKSSNGNSWQPIGSVAAAGSVSVSKNYQFTDPKGTDINYYRLKIIDMNGNASYSIVLAVKLTDAGTSVSVFPNPAVNSVNIGVGRIPASHGFTLTIFNPNGQRVITQQVAAGTNSLSLDLSHFAGGNYTLDIKFADGTSEVRKLMITK